MNKRERAEYRKNLRKNKLLDHVYERNMERQKKRWWFLRWIFGINNN